MSFGSDKSRRKGYRLFISHSWDYSDEYHRMTELLDDENRFQYENYSVPEHDELDTTSDRELRRALRDQIKPASVVIVLAGMYSHHSKWIGKEIDITENMEKAILGVEPYGRQRTPKRVQNAADEMVGWRTNSVVSAIRNLSP